MIGMIVALGMFAAYLAIAVIFVFVRNYRKPPLGWGTTKEWLDQDRQD